MKVQDENSISRQNRAAQFSAHSKEKVLSILGDSVDKKYPIYMTGDSVWGPPHKYNSSSVSSVPLDSDYFYPFQVQHYILFAQH